MSPIELSWTAKKKLTKQLCELIDMVLNITICTCEAIQRESESYLALIICMVCLRQSTNTKTNLEFEVGI